MMLPFQTQLEQVFAEVADPSNSWTEKDKGDWLEHAVLAYLNCPEHKNLSGYEWAVRWKDWDDKGLMPQQDLGIDIVVKRRDGKFIAVQCKTRSEQHDLEKKEIEPVIALSTADSRFEKALVYHTGRGLTGPAKKLAYQHGEFFAAINRTRLTRPCDQYDLKFPGLGEKWKPVSVSPRTKYDLRDYQHEAVNAACHGLAQPGVDAGKLVMPCGTGKTFTAQHIAEKHAGVGGKVLVLVPSISLMSQTMREWSQQIKDVPHRYLGVCSDESTGQTREDEFSQPIWELDLPVTTDHSKLAEALGKSSPNEMTVVFSTYQSLDKIQRAQAISGTVFDLAMMDEAHRTTGVEQGGRESKFRLIHDRTFVKATHRLYMTATPKIYVDPKNKTTLTAEDHDVYSMDDTDVYGEVLYEMSFAEAVEKKLLSPYKVVLLGVRKEEHSGVLHDYIVATLREKLENKPRRDKSKKPKQAVVDEQLAAKILGVTKFAGNFPEPSGIEPRPGDQPLQTILVFTNTIASSQAAAIGLDYGDDILKVIDKAWEARGIDMEADHVDGSFPADERDRMLDWLRRSIEDVNTCRVLSNAKCLSEGVDVPALDGCVFLEPRTSQIDVVQAVGRIMRKHKNKDCGWVILPVCTTLPDDTTDADDIDSYIRKDWKAAWSVMRALAAHDDTFRAEIEATASLLAGGGIPEKNSGRTSFAGSLNPEAGHDDELDEAADFTTSIQGELFAKWRWEEISSLVYPVIVTQLGGKIALNTAGETAGLLTSEIRTLIRNTKNRSLPDHYNQEVATALDEFHEEMREAVSERLTKSAVDDMVAQHVVMEPVFSAFFEGSTFRASSPMAKAINKLLERLTAAGLDLEKLREKQMGGFYKQVRSTVIAMDGDPAAFQGYLKEVWNAFFRAPAFRTTADKLGIAYTPIEVVDFINRSASWILREHFDTTLGSQNVGIIDPFCGMGTFLARILDSPDLIPNDVLDHKYNNELYAAELVLLAYYIAAVNIEQAYHQRKAGDVIYEPFKQVVLQDTLESFRGKRLPGTEENPEISREMLEASIRVIVSNPPYSAGKKVEGGADEENESYPEIEAVIRGEMADVAAKKGPALYNSFVKALVWAEDRLRNGGVIGYIIPAEWLKAKTHEGLRRWIDKKFDKAWILDLAGNCKTSGDEWRREGGNIFGSDTQSPVCILMLSQQPGTSAASCEVWYRRVNDYMSIDDKKAWISEIGDVSAASEATGWIKLTLNHKGRWFDSEHEGWESWLPLFSTDKKASEETATVFASTSLGLNSGRDYLAFNSSKSKIREIAETAVEIYEDHRARVIEPSSSNIDSFKWNDVAKKALRRGTKLSEKEIRIEPLMYRPFFPQWCHWEKSLNTGHYSLDEIFPPGLIDERELSLSLSLSSGRYPQGPSQQPQFTPVPTQQIITPSTWLESRDTSQGTQSDHLLPMEQCGSGNLVSRLSLSRSRQSHDLSSPMEMEGNSTKGASSATMTAILWHQRGERLAHCTPMISDYGWHGKSATRMLPRWAAPRTTKGGIFELPSAPDGWELKDNISTEAVKSFRTHYDSLGVSANIDSDRLFCYVYAMLHHPNYLTENSDSLSQEIPRVPFAPDFDRFADIGAMLLDCHLGWQAAEPWPLERDTTLSFDQSNPNSWRFKRLRWEDDGRKKTKESLKAESADDSAKPSEADFKNAIVINEHLTIRGIPKEAHTWEIGSRSALDWIVDQYKIRQHFVKSEAGGQPKISKNETGDLYIEHPEGEKRDGIQVLYPTDEQETMRPIGVVNNPNDLFQHPKELVEMIGKVTACAVQTHNLLSELAAQPYYDIPR